MEVPQSQKKWFDINYGWIKDEDFHTDGAGWHMLTVNILGENHRLIDYNGNSDSLLEGFWLGWCFDIYSQQNTMFFIECCLEALNQAIDLEFYEIAFNLNLVYTSILQYILRAELREEDYEWVEGEIPF